MRRSGTSSTRGFRRRVALAALGALGALGPARAVAQTVEHKGFLESNLIVYPRAALGDSGRAVGDALLRYEGKAKLSSRFTLQGALDARTDTHRQTERAARLSYWDRTLRRPAFSVRRLSAAYYRGPVTFEVGKQIVRWGKTDILNPTDRFAPRDYLTVIDSEVQAVTAARLTVAGQKDSLDLVFTPRFTPSRMPLLDQRWVVIPAALGNLRLRDGGVAYPGRGQAGARWNHTGDRCEYSLSFYDGFHHLPLFEPRLSLPGPAVEIRRIYPRIRTYGGDLAAPFRWFTLKAEGAWLQSSSSAADEYLLYVVQLERQ